jgi:hypothetical protein
MSDGVRTARRLADYVVLAHDPAVKSQAVDFWETSTPHYQSVVEEILKGASPAVRERLEVLAQEPACISAYWEFVEAITVDERLSQAVHAADQRILIDHRLGSAYREDSAVEVSYQELSKLPAPRSGPVPEAASAQIVIPFGDDASGGRVRNLLACLHALRDQSALRRDYTVTVVEASAAPLWQPLIEPVTDVYLFARKPGAFNKSWAVNVGVRHAFRQHEVICILDADALLSRGFIARNIDRFRQPGVQALLPFREALYLDGPSTGAAIASRLVHGAADPERARLRGFLLRRPPGLCFWIRPYVFTAIGGMDERYEGWGGEDTDLILRVTASASLDRHDDPILHLHHAPAEMGIAVASTRPTIAALSWPRDADFGRLDRFPDPDSPEPAGLNGHKPSSLNEDLVWYERTGIPRL